MIDAHVPFRRAVPGLGVGPRVLNPGGDCGRIASSAGSMLSGCTSHIFRRARRIPGRDTLQRRSFGAAHKLLGRPVSQARPQIFRVGFLKRGMHFLCALHCVLGYSSQLFHTQLEVTFPDWHTSALAHDHSQAGGSTRLLWSHATLWPSPLTPCPGITLARHGQDGDAIRFAASTTKRRRANRSCWSWGPAPVSISAS